MAKNLETFWIEERAQDMVEYTLLIALVALASAAIFTTSTQSMGSIWQRNSEALNMGSAIAAS